jgi:hypothetical protein
MNSRAPLPASLSRDAFRVREALAEGASRNRLRSSDLTTLFWGGRSFGADRLTALLPLMSTDAAFSGPTAAKLWDLPLPLRWRSDDQLHVSHLGNRRMRRAGVVSTRRGSGDVRVVGGFPVLDPVATWFSLGGFLHQDDLTAVADRIVTGTMKTPALATPAELDAGLKAAGRARWIRRLRSARGEVRVGAWSRPETLLRLLIVRAGLPEPELNVPVLLDERRQVYPDIAWPEYRIAIEYDGRQHDGETQRAADGDRHERLVDAGWIVVRVRATDLFDQPSAVVARLVRRLATRGFVATHSIDESRMVCVPR